MAHQRRVAVRIASPGAHTVERTPEVGPDVDPAFHRAILKVALELKKPSARRYDEIVAATIESMKLDAAKFRRYLGENGARNMNLLLATARNGGT